MATDGSVQPRIERLGPSFFFWYAGAWLLFLLVIALWYSTIYGHDEACLLSICFRADTIDPVGDVLPLGVPWFGMLGALLVSLRGVFHHNQDWHPEWNYWHLARPLLGAVLSIVAFALFYLTIKLTGTTPSPEGTGDFDSNLIYYVLGFLVGYRETVFQELLQRVTDLILKPAGEDKTKDGKRRERRKDRAEERAKDRPRDRS
jgi:drug/metabolite transporter (DMT)-like permease